MANFSDSIKLTVDILSGNNTSTGIGRQFSDIKSSIGEAEGAFGKFKAAGSGALDFVGQNAGSFALGAGTAIAGFAAGAIGDFQDLALGAGELRDSLGLSADEASRWVEVAGDLGIGTDKLQISMGKMLKVAGETPEVFSELGVEIARAKDGSLDANGTFLNTIDRLHGMKDPAERAAAAQKLLGKSWMDSAELIELGADGVKERLDDVSGAKILTDEQIGDARQFRDAMDDLGDRVDEVKIKIAEGLVPTLTTLAGAVGPVVDAFGKLHDVAESVADIPIAGSIVEQYINPLGRLQTAAGLAGDAWHALFGGGDDDELSMEQKKKLLDAVKQSMDNLLPSLSGIQDSFNQIQSDKLREAANNAESAAAATKIFESTQQELEESAKNVADAMRDQADAIKKQGDEALSSADASLALKDAQADLAVAIYESTAAQNDSTKSSDEKRKAVQSERDALIDVAKKQADANQKVAESQGINYTATNRLDDFNSSLLRNAQNATPAARNAIADYIVEANRIPEEKSTDIRAAIARGDFDTAYNLLTGLSATRNAYVRAEATNTAATNAELDAVANKQRVARIQAQLGSVNQTGTFATARASGGPVKKGDPYWVGEEGPELMVPSQNGTIVPTGTTGTPGSGVGGTVTNHITINTGADPEAVVDAIRKYTRRNGPGWLPS